MTATGTATRGVDGADGVGAEAVREPTQTRGAAGRAGRAALRIAGETETDGEAAVSCFHVWCYEAFVDGGV